MKVSCICATYNRPPHFQWLLEEAIESFLRQDYAEKELIVLNDCPGQELICDSPDVLVINFPKRFSSLGEKLNAGMALASGSLLTNWDDDDISLPWRLSTSIERLAEADYYNPHAYWYCGQLGLQSDHRMGTSQNCSLFRRAAFDAVNGYPHTSVDNDQVIHQRLGTHPAVKLADPLALRPDEWFYIYRRNVGPLPLSSINSPDTWSKHIGQMPVIQGRTVLRPYWKEEYVQTTRYALGMSLYEV
ncbi:MAG TPA: glycosyltransferase family A protein [Ktedonosporobacter sp.]|nr:glycosyltransferase family A protein [Ktedonosporobacter sp.]